MELKSNEKIELARGFILHSRANIFLTGKAGTGKTTLLRTIVPQLSKRAVIAAPTGVAALNAGGVTLHSLFQLPFGVYLPNGHSRRSTPRKISKNKLSLLRSLELLIIDEVSMVRSDVMDSIDETLRMVRRSSKPFAGVQLLLIGDIQQLSPICRDEEWDLLREHYNSPYFFDSHSLRKSPYVTIELDEIFRQRDSHFTNILNAVRENKMTREIFNELNSRYIPDFEAGSDYITLTTHNATANSINSHKLAEIDAPTHNFEAKVTGTFAESSYPNDTTLSLKVGAQVLFIKNDISPQKRYYNGLLGRVMSIDDRSVTVAPKSGGEAIKVEATLWEDLDYHIDGNGDVEQRVKGTFSQVPLKCAWAITIHKSQGLSFDKAIIDASGSFAHGQVYVALSRCRSLEGMVLRTPISAHSIVGDNLVESFSSYVAENQPTQEQLDEHKRENYCLTLCEIFDFEIMQRTLWDLMSELAGATAKAYPKLMSSLMDLLSTFEKDIVKVGDGFRQQLRVAILKSEDYLNDDYVKERLRLAAGYFTPRLDALRGIISQLQLVNPDSTEAKRRLVDMINRLREVSSTVLYAIKLCENGFTMEQYQSERARLVASASEAQGKSAKSRQNTDIKGDKKRGESSDIEHQELYDTLVLWRRAEAQEIDKPAYCVLSNRTLVAIQEALPQNECELKRVVGMGNVKMGLYASQIVDIVTEYCFNKGIE